jgi:hypothetical protein
MPSTNLLTRTRFDSASLASQALIAHPIAQPGHWRLETRGLPGGGGWATDVIVRKDGVARLSFDLAQAPSRGGACGGAPVVLAPGGMLNLSLQSPRDGAYALLFRGEGRAAEWDSRCLAPGDHYACMPLRPGQYEVIDKMSSARADLRVTYPKAHAGPPRHARPHALTIAVGEAFDPAALVLSPGGVLLFRIEKPSRIAIDLTAPDDGP